MSRPSFAFEISSWFRIELGGIRAAVVEDGRKIEFHCPLMTGGMNGQDWKQRRLFCGISNGLTPCLVPRKTRGFLTKCPERLDSGSMLPAPGTGAGREWSGLVERGGDGVPEGVQGDAVAVVLAGPVVVLIGDKEVAAADEAILGVYHGLVVANCCSLLCSAA